MTALIDEVIRHWYSFRLRILIARDTSDMDYGVESPLDLSDAPDG
jgi:hypothetical protein